MNLNSTSALFPWQGQAWKQLQQLQGRWPHAILLHGPVGIGKTRLAERLAQSLLCELILPDGQACGSCASCGWFLHYSHPDYRRLRPASFDADDVDAEPVSSTSDIADNDVTPVSDSAGKATKVVSKEIVINQVRSLSGFMTTSTHRHGRRVVVIYPAETMNGAASNALLKSLEEPGANTIFILVTCSVDSLLPTLVSRCHQFALTLPEKEEALRWLQNQDIDVNEAAHALAEQGGAPLAALAASQSDTQEEQRIFLRNLHHPELNEALKMAEKLQKTSIPLLLSWMQRWIYDVFSFKFANTIRYYPRYHQEIERIASRVSVPSLLKLLDTNTQRRAVADHPLSAKLVIEEMLLDYIEVCKS